ncbi:MAG: cobalamin B12-binding domain-containing protein [Dermatophilaceae bacterium]
MVDHPAPDPGEARKRILDAVPLLDGLGLREAVVSFASARGIDAVVAEVMVPVLHEVGEGWDAGRLGVVHEHFASNTFRGVLGELRSTGTSSPGRSVVLACPPDELHDLPLELFGSMLHRRSWRVVTLGADTPMTALIDAVHTLRAEACVVAGVRADVFEPHLRAFTSLASVVPVFLGGAGALALDRPVPDCTVLPPDLVRAARAVDAIRPRAVPQIRSRSALAPQRAMEAAEPAIR